MRTEKFSFIKLKGVRFYKNQSMSRYTSLQVGGSALFVAQPKDEQSLILLLEHLRKNKIGWYLLGGGTNTIFNEKGFSGVVIRLGRNFRFINFLSPPLLHVGSGASLSRLLEKCQKQGLGGLEFCYGIPGTMGGAVAGNAGMEGHSIHDFVKIIHGVTDQGKKVIIRRGEYSYGYRSVNLPLLSSQNRAHSQNKHNAIIITSVVLELNKAESQKQKHLLERYKKIRLNQPASRGTAGSIFKNPEGDFAGRLIEAAGLKGSAIGGACVSKKHGNWIVNKGNASANDVLSLISLVRKTVKKRFGVELEPEVKIVGSR